MKPQIIHLKKSILKILLVFTILSVCIACEEENVVYVNSTNTLSEGNISFNIHITKNNVTHSKSLHYTMYKSYYDSHIGITDDGMKFIFLKRYSDDMQSYLYLRFILDQQNQVVLPAIQFEVYFLIDNIIYQANSSSQTVDLQNINYSHENERVSGEFFYDYNNDETEVVSISGSFDVHMFENE